MENFVIHTMQMCSSYVSRDIIDQVYDNHSSYIYIHDIYQSIKGSTFKLLCDCTKHDDSKYRIHMPKEILYHRSKKSTSITRNDAEKSY